MSDFENFFFVDHYSDKGLRKAEIDRITLAALDNRLSARDIGTFAALVRKYHPQIRTFADVQALQMVKGGFIMVCGADTIYVRVHRLVGETTWSRWTTACREAVRSQTNDVRNAAPAFVTCPVLHSVFPVAECDVDHAGPWTFTRIVHGFLAAHNISTMKVDQLPIDMYRHAAGTDAPLLPSGLVDPFAEYHRQRATLRMVSAFANRRMQQDE